MNARVRLSRSSRPSGVLRAQWEEIDYACRFQNGSLKPGGVRQFCDECQFRFQEPGCLFTPSYRPIDEERSEANRTAASQKGARSRAKGLNSKGDRLMPSCWNCVHLRRTIDDDSKYVCRWRPQEKPVCHWTVSRSRTVEKTGCESFEIRLVMEIPYLEGET